jgi:hypothetical protein
MLLRFIQPVKSSLCVMENLLLFVEFLGYGSKRRLGVFDKELWLKEGENFPRNEKKQYERPNNKICNVSKTGQSVITPLGLPVSANGGNPPHEPRRLGWPLGSVLPHHSRQDKMDTELTTLALEKYQIANMEIGGCGMYV